MPNTLQMLSNTTRLNVCERKILTRALKVFYAQSENVLMSADFSEHEFAHLFDKVKNPEDKPWLKN